MECKCRSSFEAHAYTSRALLCAGSELAVSARQGPSSGPTLPQPVLQIRLETRQSQQLSHSSTRANIQPLHRLHPLDRSPLTDKPDAFNFTCTGKIRVSKHPPNQSPPFKIAHAVRPNRASLVCNRPSLVCTINIGRISNSARPEAKSCSTISLLHTCMYG